jgi:MSHA pilin protein MshD
MTRSRSRGFTLIELIIFIVVVGAGLAGILSVMNTVVKSSADPMVRKQAAAAAESILEEIMLKSYVHDPAAPVGTDRATYDNVDDFKGKSSAQLDVLFADLLAQIPGYSIDITVANEAPLAGVNMKKITVMVTRGGESVSLSSYRAPL